ncbi:MAG: hypothetical protein ABSH16_12340, partial [Sedimentisphaerales bacterium]
LLAGAIAAWAHLFKETGVSVVGAMGLFVIAQPVFKQRSWKQAGVDILLLLGGAAASMAPLFIWVIGWHVQTSLPFYFVWNAIAELVPKSSAGASQAGNYASQIRSVMSFAEQWPRVLRYYLALCLPISLAFGAIIVGIGRMILRLRHREGLPSGKTAYDRFLLLLGAWWVLDMAFVWISPASYEQYYLPLTVSGAMTGGFLTAVWWDKLTGAVFKTKWVITGIVGLIVMIVMSWHIFEVLIPQSSILKSETATYRGGTRLRSVSRPATRVTGKLQANIFETTQDPMTRYTSGDGCRGYIFLRRGLPQRLPLLKARCIL